MRYRQNWIAMVFLSLLLGIAVHAQDTLPDAPKPQPLPDAPSTTRPVPDTTTSPLPTSTTPAPAAQQPQMPEGDQTQAPTEPAPKPNIKTVPAGGETQSPVGPQENVGEQLATVSKTVNFVIVPVSVKDDGGRQVYGLTKDNFKILENGTVQPIKFFSSDPLGLSAAIVLDVGMPDVGFKKVQDTFNALIGAFSEYDEVAVYTYSDNVKQQQDFNAALGDRTATTMKRVSHESARAGGAATVAGPMVTGPTVNGQVFNPGDPSRPHTTSVRYIEPPHTLNDAILRAAIDLSHRPRQRRKVIFVISNGQEDRSTASYSDVLKVLLSNEVQVYAVGVDSAAIPGYSKLSKIRLPRQPYGNILPKYANATGGEVLNALDKTAMEKAYSRLMDDARNQYTIGYTSPMTLSTAYRSIEVRVSADTSVKVYARDGYYPLPPARK
ncbi:MAG TPA: VWA domain-containing protein [Terriglobales bacterium]